MTNRANGAPPEQMKAAAELANACADLAAAAGNACFDGDRTDLRIVAGMMISRGAQSVASANLLAQNGLVGDAMSCGRTMVELAIDFAYIAIDPAPRIARFDAYAHVVEYKLAANVAKHGGIVPSDFLADLKRRRDEFAADNPGRPDSWAGCSLADRAKDTGRNVLYGLAYADQCNASHSGPMTLQYTLAVDDDGSHHVEFGPQQSDAHPIALACSGMLVLIGDAVANCRLDDALGHRAVALMDRIKALGVRRWP